MAPSVSILMDLTVFYMFKVSYKLLNEFNFIIILLLLLDRNLQGSKEISRKRDLKWVSWRPV